MYPQKNSAENKNKGARKIVQFSWIFTRIYVLELLFFRERPVGVGGQVFQGPAVKPAAAAGRVMRQVIKVSRCLEAKHQTEISDQISS